MSLFVSRDTRDPGWLAKNKLEQRCTRDDCQCARVGTGSSTMCTYESPCQSGVRLSLDFFTDLGCYSRTWYTGDFISYEAGSTYACRFLCSSTFSTSQQLKNYRRLKRRITTRNGSWGSRKSFHLCILRRIARVSRRLRRKILKCSKWSFRLANFKRCSKVETEKLEKSCILAKYSFQRFVCNTAL